MPTISTATTPDPVTPDRALIVALDREADHLLHLGLHVQAERLAHQAAALREAGQ